jgi:hypothetical protein
MKCIRLARILTQWEMLVLKISTLWHNMLQFQMFQTSSYNTMGVLLNLKKVSWNVEHQHRMVVAKETQI